MKLVLFVLVALLAVAQSQTYYTMQQAVASQCNNNATCLANNVPPVPIDGQCFTSLFNPLEKSWKHFDAYSPDGTLYTCPMGYYPTPDATSWCAQYYRGMFKVVCKSPDSTVCQLGMASIPPCCRF